MTTHQLVEPIHNANGNWIILCTCGWIGAQLTEEEARRFFERHRALSRGRTRQPRPK